MLNQRKPDGPVVVDVTFPEIEKFDSLPEPSVDGPSAFVSIMEGCLQILHLLRRALHPWRGSQPPL